MSKPVLLIDTREQKHEYMIPILQEGGIEVIRTCLSHGADYIITGSCGSVGVQRKSGAMEIPKQLSDLRDDILPALAQLNDNPILLIEEDFVIGANGIFYRREEGMLHPTNLNVKAYFNFIHSIKMSGIDVVTVRNLDASIHWMIATAHYLQENHYPKIKKKFGADRQAIGSLCCINGIGITKAEELLSKYSISELIAIDATELTKMKVLNVNQIRSFEQWRAARCKPK